MQNTDISIQKMVFGGYGLGYVKGKACFVPYAVPGDDLSVDITDDRKDYCFGRIISVEKASEIRIQPQCPNFGICGGCDYLNISYDKELEFKKEILTEALTRNFKNILIIPQIEIIADKRFHYRSHASLKCDTDSKIGFFQRDTNNLKPFPDNGCILLQEILISSIKNIIHYNKAEIKVACSFDNKCIVSCSGDEIITESENNIFYERGISHFFQANKFLRKRMLDKTAELANLIKEDVFLDIGCGVGFFALNLANSVSTGYGIDINKGSIRWAKNNAKKNSINNIHFENRSAENVAAFKNKVNVIIADPPRAGLSKKARNAVKTVDPGRIVYVSCNPSTFSRDARDFIDSGYMIEKLTLIDMFPGTHHIEIIGLLVK